MYTITMCKLSLLWMCALIWSVSVAVSPLPPQNGNKRNNVDCTGPIVFSSTGSGTIHSDGLVSYKKNLVNLTVTWESDIGVFTCVCSGLYQFSFSGSTEGNTRMVLQKRLDNNKQWSPILATKPGGGSATIILEVKYGDQVAVFLEGNPKKLNTKHEQGVDVTSFSGQRIAKT